MFGHEYAVVRLISLAFALLSIELLYLIIRQWLSPGIAAVGAALWASSPLVLQFGQAPMTDILCTTGMLAAFWFAVNANLPASSGCFLFSILAKVSVAVFGLPILTALLLARNRNSIVKCLRTAFFWGTIPLLGLICWTSLGFLYPDTPWTVMKLITSKGGFYNLVDAKFYVVILGCLVPYGLGLLGTLGCAIVLALKCPSKISTGVKWALILACLLYLVFVLTRIWEPQYMLPLLAWLVVAASFGLNRIWGRISHHTYWHFVCVSLVVLHVLTSLIFTRDLKISRVPDFGKIESAARLIPPNSRVIVVYPYYGASPAVWLNQNVFAIDNEPALEADLPRLQEVGFTYILIMDERSRERSFWKSGMATIATDLLHVNSHASTEIDAGLTDFANPDSPFCRYCDQRFSRIFSSEHVVLYSLQSSAVLTHIPR